ncbi:hypothetical protein BASA61_006261 [Batrachochytrium salamandrivorans]|nr:hypothetical protein BASA61_006261 [Batrachochytrium salamandrivorans]
MVDPGMTEQQQMDQRSLQEQPPSHAAEDLEFPLFTVEHMDHCVFSFWFPLFSRCTLKSRILRPLPEDFVNYLNADGVFLPDNANTQPQTEYDVDSDTSSESSETPSEASQDSSSPLPSFPLLDAQITAAIADLGGAVFPKLNWSSPKDASWIAFGNTLKCTTPADIYLLLKSSDFIAHDLSHAYEDCVVDPTHPTTADETRPQRPQAFELVLREWFDLAPSMQFRCFVKSHHLVGMCQRDSANYYEFLDHNKDALEISICDFFDQQIDGKFPDPNYVFDVYMNARTRKVWLIDINPFGPPTDTLLFTWQEIFESTECTLRIVESIAEADFHAQSVYGHNRLPKEAFELSDGASIEAFSERFKHEIMLAQFGPCDDDGDDRQVSASVSGSNTTTDVTDLTNAGRIAPGR